MLKPLVLLVGGGNMGRALLASWRQADIVSSVAVVDPNPAENFPQHYPTLADVPEQIFDIVVLATKPQIFPEILPLLKRFVRPETLFLSIAAGKTIATMEAELGNAAIVRVMPNTPAMIGQGISVCVKNDFTTPTQFDLAKTLLGAVGQVEWIEDEKWLHAVTAISGSGPAYIFALIEAMEQAGIKLGLPSQLAAKLARKTVEGSAALAAFSPDKTPAELRKQVTSPGGTTEAALKILQGDKGLNALFEQALQAAAQRSEELGS